MESTIKHLPKGRVELTISVTPEEAKREFEAAAAHLSTERPIPGYRPGKAPYDVVRQRFGEMAIYENALTDIVRKHYVAAVTKNDLLSYGQPEVNITKIVPGAPIEFTATVALVPKVLSVADLSSISVKAKEVKVEDKDVEQALKDLQKMQVKEVRVNREVKDRDKVVVDMDLTIAGVPLEGGQARNHGIYLDEEYYIPGIKEHVLGLKEGDKKAFSLKFPETHYQKNIAGKNVDFALTAKEVYELTAPDLDDAFAKTLGQESIAKVRALIKENMMNEAQEKEKQRVEIEALDTIVDKSKFEEVPDEMVNVEVDRMLNELRQSLAERNVKFEDYLKNIKKSVDDLKIEFAPQALRRVKTALVIREIGKKENVDVSDAELLTEVQKLMNTYTDNAEVQEQLRTEDYQDFLRTTLRNRKVVDAVREKVSAKQ
jgi:trigger factor